MTHEELLAKIDWAGSNTNGNNTYSALSLAIANSMNALRAVVELHKPVVDEPDSISGEAEPYCAGCWDAEDEYYALRHFYPCPTIQAIEKELS